MAKSEKEIKMKKPFDTSTWLRPRPSWAQYDKGLFYLEKITDALFFATDMAFFRKELVK